MELNELKPYLDAVEDYQLASLYGGTLPRRWRIHIGNSAHGKGLFASERIPAGVAVTLYPAHAVGRKKGGNTYTMNVVKDIPYVAREAYFLKTPTGDVQCGYPEMTENDWLIGHMVNDCGDISCFRRGREYDAAVLYSIMSQRANIRIEWYRNIGIMVTKRDVEAGEELTWPYGLAYWFAHCSMPDWNQRITAYLLRQPKERREKMMVLLTSMDDIFKEASVLKASSSSSSSS